MEEELERLLEDVSLSPLHNSDAAPDLPAGTAMVLDQRGVEGSAVHAEGLFVRPHKDQPDALHNADVHVERGKIWAAVGHEGAGKSSLLAAIVGQMQGEARRFAVLESSSPDATRIGYVPCVASLADTLSVGEAWGLFGTLGGLSWTAIRRHTHALLQLLCLVGKEDTLIGQLSESEVCRVSLGCALIHTPRVLVLDNAFAPLPPFLKSSLMRFLHRVAHDHGTSVVLATHDWGVAVQADVVAVVHHGLVLLEQPPNKLLANWDNADGAEGPLGGVATAMGGMGAGSVWSPAVRTDAERLATAYWNVCEKFRQLSELGGGLDGLHLGEVSYRPAFESTQWDMMLANLDLDHDDDDHHHDHHHHDRGHARDVDTTSSEGDSDALASNKPSTPVLAVVDNEVTVGKGERGAVEATAAEEMGWGGSVEGGRAASQGRRWRACRTEVCWAMARAQFLSLYRVPLLLLALVALPSAAVLLFRYSVGTTIHGAKVAYTVSDRGHMGDTLKHALQQSHAYRMHRYPNATATALAPDSPLLASVFVGDDFTELLGRGMKPEGGSFLVRVASDASLPVAFQLVQDSRHALFDAVAAVAANSHGPQAQPPMSPFDFVHSTLPPDTEHAQGVACGVACGAGAVWCALAVCAVWVRKDEAARLWAASLGNAEMVVSAWLATVAASLPGVTTSVILAACLASSAPLTVSVSVLVLVVSVSLCCAGAAQSVVLATFVDPTASASTYLAVVLLVLFPSIGVCGGVWPLESVPQVLVPWLAVLLPPLLATQAVHNLALLGHSQWGVEVGRCCCVHAAFVFVALCVCVVVLRRRRVHIDA